ncbi:hypothetical protein ACFQ2M_13775 [Kitasatospora saccharophila]|uniref:hypothetical protein n=1 Tax=Kitasatospora saccharophila TaxID=407973 RepID=UPI003644DDAA
MVTAWAPPLERVNGYCQWVAGRLAVPPRVGGVMVRVVRRYWLLWLSRWLATTTASAPVAVCTVTSPGRR